MAFRDDVTKLSNLINDIYSSLVFVEENLINSIPDPDGKVRQTLISATSFANSIREYSNKLLNVVGLDEYPATRKTLQENYKQIFNACVTKSYQLTPILQTLNNSATNAESKRILAIIIKRTSRLRSDTSGLVQLTTNANSKFTLTKLADLYLDLCTSK